MLNKNVLNVLITGCGSKTATLGIIQSLNKVENQNFDYFGIDIVEKSRVFPGLKYIKGLPYNHCDYLGKISKLVKRYNIDIIFPLLEEELIILKSKYSPIAYKVVGMPCSSARIVSDTGILMDKLSKHPKIQIPKFFFLKTKDDFIRGCDFLSYPDKDVVCKPRRSRGSRGVFLITDKKLSLVERNQMPQYTREEIKAKWPDNFPDYILMEYLKGDDYTVYCFAIRGKLLFAIPVKRIEFTPGITWCGEIYKNSYITEYIKKITEFFELDSFFNVQLMLHEGTSILYEINPRFSGSSCIATYTGINLPKIMVEYHLKGSLKEVHLDYRPLKFTRLLTEYYSYF